MITLQHCGLKLIFVVIFSLSLLSSFHCRGCHYDTWLLLWWGKFMYILPDEAYPHVFDPAWHGASMLMEVGDFLVYSGARKLEGARTIQLDDGIKDIGGSFTDETLLLLLPFFLWFTIKEGPLARRRWSRASSIPAHAASFGHPDNLIPQW